nr:immunoglobulin heavy chain junction region [Mus musculus]
CATGSSYGYFDVW